MLLEVRNIAVAYGTARVLSAVSLAVDDGGIGHADRRQRSGQDILPAGDLRPGAAGGRRGVVRRRADRHRIAATTGRAGPGARAGRQAAVPAHERAAKTWSWAPICAATRRRARDMEAMFARFPILARAASPGGRQPVGRRAADPRVRPRPDGAAETAAGRRADRRSGAADGARAVADAARDPSRGRGDPAGGAERRDGAARWQAVAICWRPGGWWRRAIRRRCGRTTMSEGRIWACSSLKSPNRVANPTTSSCWTQA